MFRYNDIKRFKTHPVVMRGSRHVLRCRNGDNTLAGRFCLRAAYRLRLTTGYTNYGQATDEENEAKIARIREQADRRWPRQRTGCSVLYESDNRRFENGKLVRATDEPRIAEAMEAADALMTANRREFWYRQQTAHRLAAVLVKYDRATTMKGSQ